MKRRQAGLTSVEFALVGPAALILLFACIEIGRALFVWNTICEATRRGARVAAVTTIDATGQAAVKAAVQAYGGWDGLSDDSVNVQYYNAAGAVITGPSTSVRFVCVGIGPSSCTTSTATAVTHTLLIPFLTQNITLPSFSTTLPAESLGATS